MKISIVGLGYVGLTQFLCLANQHLGFEFVGLDIDKSKIDSLNEGKCYIYETGMEDLLNRVLFLNNSKFTTNLDDIRGSDIIFVAVPTPTLGAQDLSYLEAAINDILDTTCDESPLIVIKSTVLPGTCERVQEIVENWGCSHRVVSNPEFLKEGSSIKDFMEADKVVIGTTNDEDYELLREVYSFIEDSKIIKCTLPVAQAIKYVNNDMLATKIAKINEYRTLFSFMSSEEFSTLTRALGLDSRISPEFMVSGPGFGGSCFPKDVSALATYSLKILGKQLPLLSSTMLSNMERVEYIIKMIKATLFDLQAKSVAVLGVAFKAGTDDIREATSIKVLSGLSLDGGKDIFVHDPEAIPNLEKHWINTGDLFNTSDTDSVSDLQTKLEECDAVIVLTNWPMYKNLDFSKFKFVIDTRNMVTGVEPSKLLEL